MAGSIRSTVLIRREVEEVFSYVIDLENNGPEWAPDLESVTKTSEGPTGAGTTFDQKQRVMGMRRSTKLRFTAVEPNQTIEAEVDIGPIAPTASLTFASVEDGTQVTMTGDPNPKGPLKFLSGLAARQGQKLWDARLAQLKSVLERSTS